MDKQKKQQTSMQITNKHETCKQSQQLSTQPSNTQHKPRCEFKLYHEDQKAFRKKG